MATLDYVEIPSWATRLDDTGTMQPAQKIYTTLPQPEPAASNTNNRRVRRSSSVASPGFSAGPMSFIPQLLMGAIPTVPVVGTASIPSPTNPRKLIEPEKPTLLSSRDPLSLPIMSNNFKRFVAKVGPVFWLQDRIEEIVFWKRGWRRTMSWMALYAFLCYFPRMILLIPHALFIGIILSTYPYSSSSPDPTSSSTSDPPPIQPPPAEGTPQWQANLQGIQNLMGFTSDMITSAQPYIYHLSLTPQHLTFSTSNISSHASPTTRSPYTPYILTLLVITFFPLLILIHLPTFPIREIALVVGLFPFLITHPTTLSITPSLIHHYSQTLSPLLIKQYKRVFERIHPSFAKWIETPLRTSIQRLIDNDRLPDDIWRAEKREVELFENERYYDGTIHVVESDGQGPGWSKSNLKPGERSAWTRGRDGWTGIGPEDKISSNLTFSLSPNWRFIPTEDWRKDLTGDWAECGGADEDGWIYTNDVWLGPRPRVYSAGGLGSVTRRRRWVRRVWYDVVP